MPARFTRELRRIWSQLRKAALRVRLGRRWSPAERSLSRRVYPDYETYLAHQSLKVDALRARSLDRHDERFSAALTDRLRACRVSLEGRSVLCLAARLGTEVRVFSELGAFAVGIDLNPGKGSRWVLTGDFHALQFADRSVDLVYINSLDHAFELTRLIAEVRRVLKPAGALVAEIGLGTEEGGKPGFYEALSWTRVDDLVERIMGAGFTLEDRTSFEVPWDGVQVLLRKGAIG